MTLSLTDLLFILAMIVACSLAASFCIDSKLTSKEKAQLRELKNDDEND